MAICPECFVKDKEFWAPRCHACNQPIGFWQQCFSSWIYGTTTLLLFVFVVWSFLTMTWQWWALAAWGTVTLVPMFFYIVVPNKFLAFLIAVPASFWLTTQI